MGRVFATAILVAAALGAGSANLSLLAEERSGNVDAPKAVVQGAIDFLRTIDSGDVRKFSKPRSIWKKMLAWVAGPPAVPQLGRPYGLTEDSRGRLIVADPGIRAVHILDFERRRHQMLRGARREPFLSPLAVAVDAKDNIYVADSGRSQVYVFNRKGKFLRTLADKRSGVVLQRPTGLAIDPQRERIYLTDALRHQVLLLNLDGTLIKAIGRRGSEPGEFNFPTSLTLAGDELYVVDAMNFRIQVLTGEGDFLRSFGQLGYQSGTLSRPKGIALDSDGNVYVVDALFETVQVFDSEGRLLYYFDSTGSEEENFVLPSGIYIGPRDRIYVADSYNQRLQVFRYRPVRP